MNQPINMLAWINKNFEHIKDIKLQEHALRVHEAAMVIPFTIKPHSAIIIPEVIKKTAVKK